MRNRTAPFMIRLALYAIVGLYLGIYSIFLTTSDFIPYVLDNNESFATLNHARNLIDFGFSRSAGLTDESVGPDLAAHPYVYTHQGNFPRLFAALLLLSGVDSVEAQIAVTTMTIGLLTVVMAFVFFTRAVDVILGLAVALLLTFDYLLFGQWLVNTYRVWHCFLLFAGLLCIQQQSIKPRALASWGLFLVSLCLGYFDLMMAVFSTTFMFFYASTLYLPATPKRVFRTGLLITAGACTGLVIFLVQLLAYYGADGLATDLLLTFSARNVASDSDIASRVPNFYVENKVVFWDNYFSGREFISPATIIRSLFQFGLGIYTPLFASTVLIAIAGAVLTQSGERIFAPLVQLATWITVRPARIFATGFAAGMTLFILMLAYPAYVGRLWIYVLQGILIAILIVELVRTYRPSLGNAIVALTLTLAKWRWMVLGIACLAVLLGFSWSSAEPRVFGRYSLLFALALSTMVAFSFVIAAVACTVGETRSHHFQGEEKSDLLGPVTVVITTYLLGFSVCLFFGIVLGTNRVAALPALGRIESWGTQGDQWGLLCALILVSASIASVWTLSLIAWLKTFHTGPSIRSLVRNLALGALFLSASSFFLWIHGWLYQIDDVSIDAIWLEILHGVRYPILWKVVVLSVIASLTLALCLPRIEEGISRRAFSVVCKLFVAGFLAYVVAFIFSPGYMVTTHLRKYSPVLVFIIVPLIGLGMYLVWRLIRINIAAAKSEMSRHLRAARVTVASVAAVGLIGLMGYWLVVQATYAQLLPARGAGFLSLLKSAPFKGATFASSTYAAPLGVMTGSWSYMDPHFVVYGGYKFDDKSGFSRDRDTRYLWFANAKSKTYDDVNFIVCFNPQSIYDAVRRAMDRRDNRERLQIVNVSGTHSSTIGRQPRCNEWFPFRADAAHGDRVYRMRTVAEDFSGEGKWAIAKVAEARDLPGYIAGRDGLTEPVAIAVVSEGKRRFIRIDYQYRHQHGVKEGRSMMQVMFEPANQVAFYPEMAVLLYEGPVKRLFPIPKNIQFGVVHVYVTPVTESGRAVLRFPSNKLVLR